jgi:hypothetical protein
MFFALAVLLIQPQVHAQIAYSTENIALIQPADDVASRAAADEGPLPLAPSPVDAMPAPSMDAAALPTAPEPATTASAPAPLALIKPANPMTVSVDELRAERRHQMRLWMGLGIASHSAATFDAWTTRHAITTTGAQELDPLLKPFSGNASIYLAIQAGPALMDFVGKKMMDSRHSWVRRMWWIPQSASLASSLVCGAHNLATQ